MPSYDFGVWPLPKYHTLKRHGNRTLIAIAWAMLIASAYFARQVSAMFAPPPDLTPAYLKSDTAAITSRLTDAGYWLPAPYRGEFISVDADGSRHTIAQPVRWDRTVWMFGNSGMYDPVVPDALTACSDLQILLLTHGYRWRVVNHGAQGQAVSGQLAWLHDTPVQPGDIVMFVDGAGFNINIPRYHILEGEAQRYAESRGAAFYHLIQPDATDFSALGTPRIVLPASAFVEGAHMNAAGDALAAQAYFDVLTLI